MSGDAKTSGNVGPPTTPAGGPEEAGTLRSADAQTSAPGANPQGAEPGRSVEECSGPLADRAPDSLPPSGSRSNEAQAAEPRDTDYDEAFSWLDNEFGYQGTQYGDRPKKLAKLLARIRQRTIEQCEAAAKAGIPWRGRESARPACLERHESIDTGCLRCLVDMLGDDIAELRASRERTRAQRDANAAELAALRKVAEAARALREDETIFYKVQRTAERDALFVAIWDALAEVDRLANRSPAFEIVSAPGDRCGGSRLLGDGTKCPGCRACS